MKKSFITKNDLHDLCICIVAYFPTEISMVHLLELSKILRNVSVFNNGLHDDALRSLIGARIKVLGSGNNLGVAEGFNSLISNAFADPHINYVLMLDQDSMISIDAMMSMKSAYELYKDEFDIGLLGPNLVEQNSSLPYGKIDGAGEISVVKTLASSGTMLDRKTWEDIGPMDEDLFIDGVDHEWCFRAKAKGLNSVVAKNVILKHSMGNKSLRLFGKVKPVHTSPLRHYYIIRNTLILIGKSYIPFHWKLIELLKTLRRIVFYISVSSDKLESLKLIGKAFMHGLSGKAGKYSK